ncbi:TIGR00266 family protein [Vampirovibrio chlorellavorus]|uniref:TIGR00266 family protein n=1 Tax=Vampirovibrio chlorellavorus TaxID=758823 RepID=UPI0026F378A6|nr:TIGR00266 family protein [Vampirovibrio chlorellavorus]
MQHQIIGDDIQAVALSLAPGETVRAEAGAMLYMSDSIEMNTQVGTNKEGGMVGALMSGLKRAVSGDSFFITTFTAQGQAGQVAFAAPYPGKIMPIHLAETGTLLCQRDSYLCSDTEVDVSIAFTRKLGAGFFGGEGFILQKLSGRGQAYIHSGGGIIPFELAAGQSLRVDTGCLVAMTENVSYDIQLAKGVKNMLFGGEGLFFAHLKGPGKVWLQVLPFSRLANRILSAAVTGNSEQSKGLGGLGGNLLGGLISGE